MKLVKDLGMIFRTVDSKKKRHYGVYECPDCGSHVEIDIANVKHNNTSKCMECSRIKHGDTGKRLHRIWSAMKNRCKHSEYYTHVSVCREWYNSYETFRDWAILNGYSESLTIDRIDGSSNYCPENCRWATKQTQSENTKLIHRTNKSGYRGVSYYKKTNKWSAQVQVNRKKHHIGLFDTALEACVARDKYVVANNLGVPLNEQLQN